MKVKTHNKSVEPINYPTGNLLAHFKCLVTKPLTFGIQSPQVGFPCSIKCSKSKNYKVPQTFRDYGTKKSELLNYIFKASSNLPSKI